MEKLTMKTTEISQENIQKIRELFPNAVTEVKDFTMGGGIAMRSILTSSNKSFRGDSSRRAKSGTR